jgi:hypothetical protein
MCLLWGTKTRVLHHQVCLLIRVFNFIWCAPFYDSANGLNRASGTSCCLSITSAMFTWCDRASGRFTTASAESIAESCPSILWLALFLVWALSWERVVIQVGHSIPQVYPILGNRILNQECRLLSCYAVWFPKIRRNLLSPSSGWQELKALSQSKNLMTSARTEPATFRLVTGCLNQLRCHMSRSPASSPNNAKY